jgi:hypothetical protein
MSARLLWVLILVSFAACKGKKPMSEIVSPQRSVDSILAKIKASHSFRPEEVRAYQENPHVYPLLMERLRTLEDAGQAAAIDRFDDLGAALVAGEGGEGLAFAPYISNHFLIQGLVEFLGDKGEDVREAAVRQIFANVPDLYLRNHGKEVAEKLVAYPQTSRAAQLLAKTGSERALALIRSNRAIREQDELWTAQALAKLGDSAKEDFLIGKYRKEKDDGEKRELALMLGFVATPRTILALARDLRNPMTYEWNQTGLRSFRVHVIQGLSRAYPMEPLLWKPDGTPRDDRYYDAIEDWAESKLGVTWDAPRPPFLYEMEVPAPAGG